MPKRWLMFCLGWSEGSDNGSNVRRAWSRLTLVFILASFIETISGWVKTDEGLGVLTYATLIWSLMFFITVVFLQPLRSSDTFRIDAPRLLKDTLISGGLMILAFSCVFRLHGMVPPDHLGREVISSDALYFSAVTFSTLGFGDFAPAAGARGYAAIEALMGNIHLGFVVGAIFAVIGREFNR